MDKKFVSVETTTCFKFTNLVRKIKASLKNKYPDVKGEAFDDLMYKALKVFKLNSGKPNEQSFDYHKNPNHLGGVRWYVICPKCGKWCLHLYLPDKHPDREQRYLCKECHYLKNFSLIMGNSKRYIKVIKPLKQLDKIRAQLLKKSMMPTKAQALLDEYKRIEDELSASPEYRLWKFQKEHGM